MKTFNELIEHYYFNDENYELIKEYFMNIRDNMSEHESFAKLNEETQFAYCQTIVIIVTQSKSQLSNSLLIKPKNRFYSHSIDRNHNYKINGTISIDFNNDATVINQRDVDEVSFNNSNKDFVNKVLERYSSDILHNTKNYMEWLKEKGNYLVRTDGVIETIDEKNLEHFMVNKSLPPDVKFSEPEHKSKYIKR